MRTYISTFALTLSALCQAWGFGMSVFSAKDYATSIEHHGWLANESQVCEAVCQKKDPTQLEYGELTDRPAYLIFRLENSKGYRAWGTLEVSTTPGFRVTIQVRDLAPHFKEHQYYVIPLGTSLVPPSMYSDHPDICFHWKKLYVK